MLKTFYEEFETNNPGLLEIIFISRDRDEPSFEEYYGEMPWLALPFSNRDLSNSLSTKFKVAGIPTLAIVNTETGELVTDKARMEIMRDSKGENFPWPPKSLDELLGDTFVTHDGTGKTIEDLNGKHLLLYFSAHWCGPCRRFTPTLSTFYNETHEEKDFEIVFVSLDRDESSFNEYLSEMPWSAIPYDNSAERTELAEKFGVQGIPSLIVMDEDRNVITDSGVGRVYSDASGEEFPWFPKPLNPLDGDSAQSLNSAAGLILFHDGVEDASALVEIMEGYENYATTQFEEMKSKDDDERLYFFFSSGADPLTERVKHFLGHDLPEGLYACILDLPKRQTYSLAGTPSLEEFIGFADGYLAGNLTPTPMHMH
jgi:nucleoredoxin